MGVSHAGGGHRTNGLIQQSVKDGEIVDGKIPK